LYAQSEYNLFYQEYLCLLQSKEKKLFNPKDFRYFSHIWYNDKIKSTTFKNAKQSEKIFAKEPLNIVLQDKTKIPISSCYIHSAMDLVSDGKDKSAIVTVAYDSKGN